MAVDAMVGRALPPRRGGGRPVSLCIDAGLRRSGEDGARRSRRWRAVPRRGANATPDPKGAKIWSGGAVRTAGTTGCRAFLPPATEMPTIRHVARAAGVSVSSVSKVLNEKPNVSAQVRERVRTVVREMGYRPSIAARALHTKGMQTLACLVPS